METDIGNPIEYNPTVDPLNQEIEHEKQEMVEDQPYYFHPSEMNYPPPHLSKMQKSIYSRTLINLRG